MEHLWREFFLTLRILTCATNFGLLAGKDYQSADKETLGRIWKISPIRCEKDEKSVEKQEKEKEFPEFLKKRLMKAQFPVTLSELTTCGSLSKPSFSNAMIQISVS